MMLDKRQGTTISRDFHTLPHLVLETDFHPRKPPDTPMSLILKFKLEAHIISRVW